MIKLPLYIFKETRVKDHIIINRRSIRFYIKTEYLKKGVEIEKILFEHIVYMDDYCRCVFCGFLRCLKEVTMLIEKDHVIFINEKFKLESRICFDSINLNCKKREYNKKSEEYIRKVYPPDVAEKKLKDRKKIAKGRFTLQWFIKKYGDEGKRKYDEHHKKIRKKLSLEGYIEKYGEIEGKKKWEEYKDKFRISKNQQWYIEKYGEIEGKKKWEQRCEHLRNLNNKEYYVSKYGEEKWKRRYANLNNYIFKYGDEGKRKYEEYCKSKEITLKNLQNKYGEIEGKKKWEDFKERSKITIEKMIERHGEEKGKEIFKNWLDKLKNKCTLNWYIEKYGEIEGKKKWEEFCRKSTVSLENMIKKYGVEEGKKRYIYWKEKIINCSHTSRSRISQELFLSVYNEIKFLNHDIKFHSLNGEYCIKINLEKWYYVDFIDLTTKKIIEFNGDYWHANPQYYTESDIIFNVLTAKDLWVKDEIKIKNLNKLDFQVLVIWESDYAKNKEETIKKCINFLKG